MGGITEFYTGRSIFITGVTGFLGKVLLEKLLFSCPGIVRIYVLIRPKKGQDTHSRLVDVLKSKLFEKVAHETPGFRDKVVAMQGDILDPNLGLNEEDLKTLKAEVSVVFHSAATVRFDEPLRLAIRMNVLGVRQLLAVCREMPLLESLCHVSTAYANCDKSTIIEEVYKPPVHPQKVIAAAEWMSDDVLNSLTDKLIKPRPNTYTYTKALAEYLLLEERGSLPCCIVRPSIIGSSWKHPFPGWVDNFNGPSGLLAAIGKGLLRVMMGANENTADIIPVDICVNLMIVSAWNTATERPEVVPVYNCTSGQINKVLWGQLRDASYYVYVEQPFDNPVRIPDPKFTNSRIYRFFHVYLDHYLPAWIIDTASKLSGNKARLVRLQRRLWRSVETLEYFTSREWDFHSNQVQGLGERLTSSDKQEFNFDVGEVNWKNYFENYCLGVKCYAMNEKMSAIDKARRQMTQLFWMRRIFNLVVVIIGWRYLMTKFRAARDLYFFLQAMMIKASQRIHTLIRSNSWM